MKRELAEIASSKKNVFKDRETCFGEPQKTDLSNFSF